MAMTKAKKVLGMMLAALMCFALTPAAAFAAAPGSDEDTGTIKVEGALKGQTYKLYKVADLAVNSTDNPTGYTYTTAEGYQGYWELIGGTPEASDASGVEYNNGQIIVKSSMNEAQVASIAEGLKNYIANAEGLEPIQEKFYDGEGDLEFTGLSLGYYFLNSTTGSVCSLTTLVDTATIEEKNEIPYVEAGIIANPNAEATPTATAQIGDTISFRTVIYVPKNAKNLILHNAVTEGLTFGGAETVSVYMGTTSTEFNTTPLVDAFTVEFTDVANKLENCDFEVRIYDEFIAEQPGGFWLAVDYTAVLNSNAVASENGLTANAVNALLTYGDSNTATMMTTASVFTSLVKVIKTDAAVDDSRLPGATFKLTTTADTNTNIKFVKKAESLNTYAVAMPNEAEGAVEEITTDESGEFTIIGLGLGNYALTETAAPAGYNPLTASEAVDVKIAQDLIHIDPVTVEVKNSAGTMLPSTGGMGTTILYVVGAVLVIAAGAFLIVRRRRNAVK